MLNYKPKILFIIPPYLPFDEYRPKKHGQKLPTLTPPYGVLSIISYINKNNKYDNCIQILDLNDEIINNKCESEKDCRQHIYTRLAIFDPDITCISALFNTCFTHLKYICDEINQYNRYITIIIGGGLATNLYQELFKEIPEIDAICYGEGEIPFLKYLELNFKWSPAWITRDSLALNIKPQFDFIENLDEIPIIDFSYIDLKKYNGRSYIEKDLTSGKIEISIHTSRGCPYRCVYCANGTVHGKKIRKMSTDRVLETIQYYVSEYKMNILMIEDDHFLADKERSLYILHELHKFDISVEFPNGIAVFQIDDDIAKALYKAHVKILPLAIESGSNYILKNIINKPLNTKIIRRAVKVLKKYDILLHAFIIIGFPGEIDVHRKESLDLLLDIGIDWAHIFIVVPIAGSRLYEECKANGYLLSEDYNDYTVSKCNIKAPGINPKQIEDYAYYMNIIINYLENNNFKNRKYDKCLSYFKNVINHYPNNAIAHWMLFEIYSDNYSKYYNFFESMREKQIFKDIINENKFYNTLIEKLKLEGYKFGII